MCASFWLIESRVFFGHLNDRKNNRKHLPINFGQLKNIKLEFGCKNKAPTFDKVLIYQFYSNPYF